MEQEVAVNFCHICFSCVYRNNKLFRPWNQYSFFFFFLFEWAMPEVSPGPHRKEFDLCPLWDYFWGAAFLWSWWDLCRSEVMERVQREQRDGTHERKTAILSAHNLILPLHRFWKTFNFCIVSWSKNRNLSLSSNHGNVETMITVNYLYLWDRAGVIAGWHRS